MQGSLQEAKGSSYLLGLINFVVVFFLVVALWYVFMHANGVIKLYTPMYGFCLVVVLLCSVVLISKVADFFPFREDAESGQGGLGRGLLLTIVAVILGLIINYVFFWGFIGKYGVAYFSPASIMVSGGTGSDPFLARENASTAIIYLGAAFLWWALGWNLGFGRWPWVASSRGVMAWSRLVTVMFFTIITYVTLFHPHVCHMFYPPQNKAGVDPWWASFSGTSSAFFSLGLVLCSVLWIVISDLLWEGYPWKILESAGQGTFAKGLVTMVATTGIGVITFIIMLKIMTAYWMEPFEGGQYTDAPYFRYLHAGELSGFIILAAFVLKTYFKNFPSGLSLPIRALIRTVLAFGGGMAIYYFYYSPASTVLLGKVPGIAQPDDTPLVWTMLFLLVVMVQAEFFGGWPLKRPSRS